MVRRLIKATADRCGTLALQDDPLLLHCTQVLSYLLIFLLEFIVLFGQALDLTLLLFGFQFSICSVFVVFTAELIDLFSLFLSRA